MLDAPLGIPSITAIPNEPRRKRPTPALVCYHSQQCAEKSLKVFLLKHNITFEKAHNLLELNGACVNVDASFAFVSDWLDLEHIDRALAAVQQAGVKLQIGFNRRFDPSFRRVHDVVASGKIGRAHILRITSRDPAPPPLAYVKVSGGIFLDMTIHDFDMARYQVGEVDEVYAAGNVLVDPEIGNAGDIDTAVITLKFANGALGVIDNSRQAVFGYDQRVEVLCSSGMVAAGNKFPDTFTLSDANSISTSLPLNFFMERYAESFVAEMKAFVTSIVEDKTPPVTGIDGRIPVVMGIAAKMSYAEKRPVKLSEVDHV